MMDYEFGALAKYLDAHPGRAAQVGRHDGKWWIRVASSLGFGATPAEAAASVCNAFFVADAEDPFSRDAIDRAMRAELPMIPEKG